MAVVIVDNVKSGKNAQKSAVVVVLRDLDAAYSLADMLDASLEACAGGGDWEIDGHTIGHDVTGVVKLVMPGVVPERPPVSRDVRYFAPVSVSHNLDASKVTQLNLLAAVEDSCLLDAAIARTCEVHDVRIMGLVTDGGNGIRFIPVDGVALQCQSSNNSDDMEVVWAGGRLVYNPYTGAANVFMEDDQADVKSLQLSVYLRNCNLR